MLQGNLPPHLKGTLLPWIHRCHLHYKTTLVKAIAFSIFMLTLVCVSSITKEFSQNQNICILSLKSHVQEFQQYYQNLPLLYINSVHFLSRDLQQFTNADFFLCFYCHLVIDCIVLEFTIDFTFSSFQIHYPFIVKTNMFLVSLQSLRVTQYRYL